MTCTQESVYLRPRKSASVISVSSMTQDKTAKLSKFVNMLLTVHFLMLEMFLYNKQTYKQTNK